VLSATTATLPRDLARLATAQRIHYVSTDIRGARIVVTGLVLTPRTGRTSTTVAWAHGTTGLADRCAPSAHPEVFWPEAQAAVAELLERGWTVAAADYPGLGTPAPHPYLVGGSAARSVIDSVKAARHLDRTLSTQYAVDGHSQGGQAALWVSELAPTYDGALVLRGTVAIAPVSNLELIAPFIPGTPGQGYLVMALYGIQAVEPTFRPDAVLAPPAEQLLPVLRRGCLPEILGAYQPLAADELVVGGEVPQGVLDRLARYGNPLQSRPSAPILLVHGTADEAVPYDITAGPLVDRLEEVDARYRLVPVEGADHEGAVFATTTLVADWIAARFR
ncbi:MAG TPA: alpha/beta fold hydrolase, partial [Actinoplanes sp.]|nr:alpha/beta fold hydrolase [Actinoplanes sp.]